MYFRPKIVMAFIGLTLVQPLFAKSNADSVSETPKVMDFNNLKVNGNFNVILTKGKSGSIKVVAPNKDAMESVVVKNGVTLSVTMKDGAKEGATLYITVKDIQQIALNISGTVSCTNTIEADDITLTLDGNATGTMLVESKMLNYTSNSNKSVVLKGKAKSCIFKDTGEGAVDASELKTDNMTLEDDSDGDLKVFVHPELHAKVNGSGNLTYYGAPRIKTFKLSGQATDQQIIENK